MTKRIDDMTAEAGESAIWAPAADFTVQGRAAVESTVVIELLARLDVAAPWVAVASFRPASQPLLRCRKLPEVKLAYSGNRPGDAVAAWSVE